MRYITFFVLIALSACAAKPTVAPEKSSGELSQATQPLTPSKETKSSDSAKDAAATTCKNGSDVRTLSNVSGDGKCELKYTKFGKESIAASASSDLAHCERVKARIIENLGKAGFTCQ